MLSSKDGLFDRARGRMVGSDEYLTKPFTKDSLLKAVSQCARRTALFPSRLLHPNEEPPCPSRKSGRRRFAHRTPCPERTAGQEAASGRHRREAARKPSPKAKAEMPDLILMDVVMPGINGYQATRTITRDEATKQHPCHHVHQQGPGDRQDLGHAPGRNDYLVKPIDPKTCSTRSPHQAWFCGIANMRGTACTAWWTSRPSRAASRPRASNADNTAVAPADAKFSINSRAARVNRVLGLLRDPKD
jgi:DNA-binding response OmpR family regulator